MMRSKKHNDGQQSNQQGFTILESLVAILVVSILLIAISPVIVLSIGVRLQAKRVDLAARAARLYIDGVKSGEIAPPDHTIELDEKNTSNDFIPLRDLFVDAPTPSRTLSFSCALDDTYCANTNALPDFSLYCVDGDDDGINQCTADSNRDLIIQAFRSTFPANATVNPGYLLGVRVYRADGFRDIGNIPLKHDEGQQLVASGGLGDRKKPLFQITTEVVTDNTSLADYCNRFGGCQ